MSKPVYLWRVQLSGGQSGQVRSSTQRGASAAAIKKYYLRGDGMPVKVTRAAGGALTSAQKSKSDYREEGTRKNPSNVYRVYVKASQGSKAKLDSEHATLADAQRRRNQFGGYAYEATIRRGRGAVKKNPTKAQKREKTRKASAKRRVAVALKNFLKKANPAGKYAGAKMQRNKGGSITIIPIKLRRAK